MPKQTTQKVIPTREQLSAQFESDPKLRAEFKSAEIFIAFRMAEAKGRFKRMPATVKSFTGVGAA